MENYSVILFESNNYVSWCISEFKEDGIDAKIVNVPRHLSSDCGYCVRISTTDRERAIGTMRDRGIEYEDIKNLLQ